MNNKFKGIYDPTKTIYITNTTNGRGYGKTQRMIEQLQQENHQLKEELERLKQPTIFIDTQDMEERYGEELYKEYLENENHQLKDRIEKAIEYIENNTLYEEEYDYNYEEELYLSGIDDDVASETLIAILKGEENDN